MLSINSLKYNVFSNQKEIDLSQYGRYLLYNGFSRPAMLICETINSCNNNCVICANAIMTRRKEIMSMKIFEEIIRSYIDMGGGRLSLTPVVGDIFMDPLLSERIALIKQYKLKGITSLSVTTNAVLAIKYPEPELKSILGQFDKIFISIYGLDADEYRQMTQRDSFEDMIQSVKTLQRLIDKPEKISFGFRLLRDYTANGLDLWIRDHFNRRVVFQAMNTYANWGRPDALQPLPGFARWIPITENASQCLIPLIAMQVFSNGNVSFCSCDDYDADEELSLGNIRDAGLIELYNREKVRNLWNFATGMPLFCKRCSFHRPISQFNICSLLENPLDFIGG